MQEFTERLYNVSDSYYGFVVAVLTYVKKKSSRFDSVNQYMINNPKALTSDILEYITNQEDFFEDGLGMNAMVG